MHGASQILGDALTENQASIVYRCLEGSRAAARPVCTRRFRATSIDDARRSLPPAAPTLRQLDICLQI
jgi:hypothetical protein